MGDLGGEAIALEEVQKLAQAGKEPKKSENQGIAKRAFLTLYQIRLIVRT